MTVRVGMLAPMQCELQPIVRALSMEGKGSHFVGRSGAVEVVALLTNIGMANGAAAARRALEQGVDHVMVVGIAGGLDSNVLQIGEVIVPEVVVGRAMEREFVPTFLGAITPRGRLSCGDDFITDPAALALMAAEGVIAVDMETAAVAEVCEDAGVPWSVFRGISDFAGEGLVDDALFALTQPDGTADQSALTKYLEENPDRLEILQRLAKDTEKATVGAAEAAIAACAALERVA
jgi:adenosylhomocysteine nucleosidase